MNKPNSIKKILFQFILISITLPLIVLGFIEIIISSKVLSNEISKSETAYVNVMVETLAHYLIHPKTEVNEIINLLESEIYIGNDHDLEKMAKLIIKIYPQIRNVQITSKDGIVTEIFPYDETFIGLDVSGYGYYKEAVKRNNEYWSASYLSPVYKEPIVSLCIPYTNGYLILNMTLYDIDIFLGSFFDEKQSLLYSITDQNAVYISHMDKNKVLLRENNNSFNKNFNIWNGGVIQEKVKYNNIEYYSYSQFIPSLNWMVTLYKPTSAIKRSLIFMVLILVLVTFIILSIGIYSGQLISRKIIHPLLSLLDATRIISSGEYKTRIPEFDILEFSELAGSFNTMSESIMVSHSGLESEVEKRTKELEKSQKQLILLERMANLGGLVAGVSHEINTPLGIIVTSASFMNDEVRNLNKNFENGHLTKALFNDFCNNATESSSLILSNSRRASDLIKSFKKVAVDQASDDKRVFKIGLYTQEIYTSLYHKFKKTAIDVNIHYETDIDVNSYPGAYSQVITNLLMNSLFHGFPVTKEGKIDIGIEHIDDNVKIIYTDNGEGISEEHLAKIFNPFFTTKRDEGGSGLGLNIVYNIVTQKLNGDVLCDSKKGEYTTFKITFPIINETTEL